MCNLVFVIIDKKYKYVIIYKVKNNYGGSFMLAKIWKKVLLIILIVACLFNLVTKLVHKLPFLKELELSAIYTITKK